MDALEPLLGEFVWHSLTVDPTIEQISAAHYDVVRDVMTKHDVKFSSELRVLEVAAYAHITGYQLTAQLGVRVELFDLSANTLRLGRRIALQHGFPVDRTTRTSGDFHALPYVDDYFDLVYICSALHHTWRWQQVLSEMIRVLAPGGILFLENEPCRRDFCFSKFRTNRMESFSPFEKKLEELGIIRTIAEPFLGSRPETLFRMVENQSMPLGAILEAVRSACSLLDISLQPEMTMGSFEQDLVSRKNQQSSDTTQWLTKRLTDLIEQAGGSLTDNDRGLGFALPTGNEIQSLCARTARAISDMPSDQNSWEFRKALSELFGSPVRLTARKGGRCARNRSGPMSRDYSEIDNVVIAMPPDVARLLDSEACLVPDIQSADQDVLGRSFRDSDWTAVTSANNIKELVPTVREPRVYLSLSRPGSLIVLIRMRAAFRGRPYRVVLCNDDRELSGFTIFQSESFLLSEIIKFRRQLTEVAISLKTISLDDADQPVDCLQIHYVGAFML